MNKKRYFILSVVATVSALVFLYRGVSPALGTTLEDDRHETVTDIAGEVSPLLEGTIADNGYKALVNEDANIIIDPQQTLYPLLERLTGLRSGDSGVINILHIGDSHVQAGFWDARIREHFTRDFGSGGRGLILPHRLTGTNEPRDYYIRTNVGHESFRTTANPSRRKLGFSGTAVLFTGGAPQVEIWHKGGFDAVTVHHDPNAPFLAPPPSLLLDMQCTMGDTQTSTTYYLNRMVDTLRMRAVEAPKDYVPMYYGFTLHGGGSGVIYHSLGANSAAFEHIERNTTITDGGAADLLPDLIIVSLGTNNCFGRNYRSQGLRVIAERFFESLAESYPGVPVIATTPRESCNLSGGKRVPNPNIEDAASVIRETAVRLGLACWDFYDAAGGRGIAETWYRLNLSGRDRIHLTETGYQLAGDMFYDAFAKYYNEYVSLPDHIRNSRELMRPLAQAPPEREYTGAWTRPDYTSADNDPT